MGGNVCRPYSALRVRTYPQSMRWFVRIFVGVILVGLAALFLIALMPRVSKPHLRSPARDNIRTMLVFMIGRRAEKVTGGWPAYSGKNFVLSLVATNQLDRRNAQNLEVLFPPSMREQFEALDLDEYKQVTKANLQTRRFPHLTGYAGRRNADPEFAMNAEREKRGVVLIADLTHPDGILVGMSNGAVYLMEWEDLDLPPPSGPVVVGPKAQHPMLRALSNE